MAPRGVLATRAWPLLVLALALAGAHGWTPGASSGPGHVVAAHSGRCAARALRDASAHMAAGARSRRSSNHGFQRSQRVGQVVRAELSDVIQRGVVHQQRNTLKEDLRQMISVVDVAVTDDLRSANVRVSTYGEKLDTIRAIRWLEDNRKSVRFELAQRLTHMKRIPDLHFTTVDISGPVRVMALIDTLSDQQQPAGAADDEGERNDDDELDFDWGDGDDESG